MPADRRTIYWHQGDRVRIRWCSFGTEIRTLTEDEAAELNDGENPWYPWRIDCVELVEDEP